MESTYYIFKVMTHDGHNYLKAYTGYLTVEDCHVIISYKYASVQYIDTVFSDSQTVQEYLVYLAKKNTIGAHQISDSISNAPRKAMSKAYYF